MPRHLSASDLCLTAVSADPGYAVAEVDSAQQRRDLDELREVEAALHRLDVGSYGDCADCGEPIALQRLRVQPAAQRCAACQTAREHAPDR